jgi:hypothetical protein
MFEPPKSGLTAPPIIFIGTMHDVQSSVLHQSLERQSCHVRGELVRRCLFLGSRRSRACRLRKGVLSVDASFSKLRRFHESIRCWARKRSWVPAGIQVTTE